ncbi:hypothetical protein Fmac_010287 [Flemingia macrophylla]|uniref:Uncharacterized protein n=1 Tax=Flemingia macrophylla TaxID=520843 RepID=A0ABD1MJ62_9FABA
MPAAGYNTIVSLFIFASTERRILRCMLYKNGDFKTTSTNKNQSRQSFYLLPYLKFLFSQFNLYKNLSKL